MKGLALQLTGSRILGFVWQHCLLLLSLEVMTLGVALCVRSDMGSSVISSLPVAMSMAGAEGLVPTFTVGEYTNLMNVLLVVAQVLILRRRFERVQFFQLLIGFVFGALIDFNMFLTSFFSFDGLLKGAMAQLGGCTLLGVGIAAEVRCGSVTMPGEGIQVAVSRVSGVPFAKVKVMIDSTLVALAVGSCYFFWGKWQWCVVGPGTLFAMFYVGTLVRFCAPHMGWFDRLLAYRPGFRRIIIGLARFIYPRH